MSGSPNVLTIGTLVDSHFYADNNLDNNGDNKYTITVTLADDDDGFDTKSFEVTVFNVNPTLNPVAATDVNTNGQTTLELEFSDPGADSFEVLIDWGDKLACPPTSDSSWKRFTPVPRPSRSRSRTPTQVRRIRCTRRPTSPYQ